MCGCKNVNMVQNKMVSRKQQVFVRTKCGLQNITGTGTFNGGCVQFAVFCKCFETLIIFLVYFASKMLDLLV